MFPFFLSIYVCIYYIYVAGFFASLMETRCHRASAGNGLVAGLCTASMVFTMAKMNLLDNEWSKILYIHSYILFKALAEGLLEIIAWNHYLYLPVEVAVSNDWYSLIFIKSISTRCYLWGYDFTPPLSADIETKTRSRGIANTRYKPIWVPIALTYFNLEGGSTHFSLFLVWLTTNY